MNVERGEKDLLDLVVSNDNLPTEGDCSTIDD
jgi:hypothetical protein